MRLLPNYKTSMTDEIIRLLDFLKNHDYKEIQRLPLRKYPLSSYRLIINELDLIKKALLNQSNIFSISLNPSIYFSRFGRDILILREFFFLNKSFPLCAWETYFKKDWVEGWIQNGLIREECDKNFRFIYRIVPFGSQQYFITSRFLRSEEHFTFLSYDSLYFASFLKKRLKELSVCCDTALDLCCGVGIQAFIMSPFSEKVLGIDINPAAIKLAKLNAKLNKLSNCEFRIGMLFEGLTNKYDLVVSNPPFIFAEDNCRDAIDSYGGDPYGLGFTFEIIRRMPEFLAKQNGRAFILTRSPVIRGEDYLFANIKKWKSKELACQYHYVSDSIVPLSPFEKYHGIKGYRHVILELYYGGSIDFIRYPFFHRATSLF